MWKGNFQLGSSILVISPPAVSQRGFGGGRHFGFGAFLPYDRPFPFGVHHPSVVLWRLPFCFVWVSSWRRPVSVQFSSLESTIAPFSPLFQFIGIIILVFPLSLVRSCPFSVSFLKRAHMLRARHFFFPSTSLWCAPLVSRSLLLSISSRFKLGSSEISFFFFASRHFAFLFPPCYFAFHHSRSTLAFPHSWISKFILFSHISVSIIPPKVPFSFILISVLATHFHSNISFNSIQIQFILVPSLFD